PGDEKIYVGSTIKPIKYRLLTHIADSVKRPQTPVYAHFRGRWNDVQVELIEAYPCTSKDELHKREQYWCDILHPTLNSYQAIITPKPTTKRTVKDTERAQYELKWRQENKEHLDEYWKARRADPELAKE